MYTILNGAFGNVFLNIKILQKSVMSRDSVDRHRDLSDQSQFLSLHENLSPSSTRIESHPELSGGSLHPLEDLLTAGSAFIHAFLDFTHCTPSGQPKPDLLILPLKELPVWQFWHFCCLFCSRWFSSLSSSMWILALGFGSASIHNFLVSCKWPPESLQVLFYLFLSIERIDIVNHEFPVLLGKFHQGSCFLYFLSIVQKHLQLLMWHPGFPLGQARVSWFPSSAGWATSKWWFGVCVGMSLVSGLCLGWLIHFWSRLESLRQWVAASGPEHLPTATPTAGRSGCTWSAGLVSSPFCTCENPGYSLEKTLFSGCSVIFFPLKECAWLFSPLCFLSLGWLSDVFSDM